MQIYQIHNKLDNKSYIGQTKKDFKYRYRNSWQKRTGNIHLKRAAAKYGIENFEITILFDNDDSSKGILNKLEKYFIEELNTLHPNGYNFYIGGDSREHTQIIKDKISESRRKGRTYEFKSPEGKIYKVENLTSFCTEYRLDISHMHKVACGKLKQHSGWTIPLTELPIKKFRSPDGDIHLVKYKELRPFCRKNHLCNSLMCRVWQGKYRQHKGWVKA